MQLDAIRINAPRPPRILIYGDAGVGKTTFAAGAESPIFIPTEDGLGTIPVAAFPLASTFGDVVDAIGALYTTEALPYHTVVVDSLDWLEQLIWSHVAREGGHRSIEGYGYGKGYILAADKLRDVLDGLEALRERHGMTVVLIAHAIVKRFDDPRSEPYDRYQLKLHARAAALVTEWSDIVGFAAQEMTVRREQVGFGQTAARGIVTGGHVLHLARTPAYDAKSRWPMPPTVPLDWGAFMTALVPPPNTDTQPNIQPLPNAGA